MKKNSVKGGGVLGIGIAVLWFSVVIPLWISYRYTGGHLGYTLDDSYIHMAIARSFSQEGIWGVTTHHFSSSSSSLLWTALLSLFYWFTGPVEIIPLVLNVAFGTALLVLVDRLLVGSNVSRPLRLGAQLAIVLGTPLAPVLLSGLEHGLHSVLALAFLFVGAWVVAGFGGGGRNAPGWLRSERLLFVLGAFTVLARFEGLFMVAVLSFLLVLQGRMRAAAKLVGASLIPLSLFGLISVAEGWYFLPNSVVMKASRPELSALGLLKFVLGFTPMGATGFRRIVENPHVLMPTLGALILYFRRRASRGGLSDPPSNALIIFVMTMILHMQFARIGWFFRYEAYLLVLGFFVTAWAWKGEREGGAREGGGDVSFPDAGPRMVEARAVDPALPSNRDASGWTPRKIPRLVMLLVGIILCSAPFVERSVQAFVRTPRAIINIYEQQYQMGLFLREWYAEDGVVVNDIGAVSFLANPRLTDFWGLGSIEVAEAKRRHTFNPATMRRLAEAGGARIAILYDEWFTDYGGLPPEWIRVGTWTIPDNVICSSDTVVFYALHPEEADLLRRRLETFRGRLPHEVIYRSLMND